MPFLLAGLGIFLLVAALDAFKSRESAVLGSVLIAAAVVMLVLAAWLGKKAE